MRASALSASSRKTTPAGLMHNCVVEKSACPARAWIAAGAFPAAASCVSAECLKSWKGRVAPRSSSSARRNAAASSYFAQPQAISESAP